ncbi:MAG TPA: major facilitator superfamily domain-containing protein 6 [Anaerolineaceae bacterium]
MTQPRGLTVIKGLYFFYFAAFGVFTVFINVYYHNIGLSGVQIGWINAVAPLVGIFAGPLWGYLSDRTGRPRALIAVGIVGSALGVLGISAVRTFLWLLPLAGVYQLFVATIPPLIDTTNLALLGEHKDRYGRQRIWGTIGYIISTLILGAVLERVGLHWLFYGYAAIMLVMLGVAAFMPARAVHRESSERGDLRALIRQPEWLFFAASLIPLWICSNGMYAFLGVYMKEMGASAGLIGMSSSINAMAEAPMMLFSSFLVRRLGLKRMLGLAYGLYAVRFLLYGLMPSPEWALAIGLMHGVTFGMFWVSAVVYMSELAPPSLRTTNQTLLWALMNFAGVIGSPVSGWIFDHIGPAQLFRLYALLALLALAVLLVGFANSRKRAEGQPAAPEIILPPDRNELL